MRSAPALVLLLLSLPGCLAHEDEAEAELAEPAARPARPRPSPSSASVPDAAAPTSAPIGEASFDAPPPDDDDRDGPIPPTSAGRPPDGASLDVDGELARRAIALGDAGKPDEMRAEWLKLVRDHPMSPYVPLAYATFGDHYFHEGDPETAAKFYEKALQFAESPVRARSLYMLAWCDLRRGEGAKALERFVQTLRAIEDGHAGGTTDAETLAAATRRDLVIAYAIVGKPEKAAAFFAHLAKGPATDDVPPAAQLDLLGRRLTADGHGSEAVVVCTDLKKADPRATCDW